MDKLGAMLALYDKYEFFPYIVAQGHTLHNLINFFFRKQGRLICRNGFIMPFTRNNERDIKNLFKFCAQYGAQFSYAEGFWHYKDGVVETPNGIRFYVQRFNPLIFAETFLYDVHFSDWDLKGKVVVQAGGFTGDTALYYASRGAKVFSFEPDPLNFELALRNVNLNPKLSENIVIKNYAIGNDEEIDFPVDNYGTGGSSAYSISGENTVKVKSISISSVLKEFNIEDPFLLDLDIKGMEFRVIKDPAISKFKLVRIEYSTVIGKNQIGKREQLVSILNDMGFSNIRIFKHNQGIYDLLIHGTIEAKR